MIIYSGNHIQCIIIRDVHIKVQWWTVDNNKKTIHTIIFILITYVNRLYFGIIIKTRWITWLVTGNMDTMDIIKQILGWFPNGNMQEGVVEIEGNDPVLSMNLLFSTMTLRNIIHLDRAISGLWSGEKISTSPFNDRRIFDLNNCGDIGEIHSSRPWFNGHGQWLWGLIETNRSDRP